MTGLIKRGHSQNQLATTVVTTEWDKFIDEQNLGDIMETINKSSISHNSYYFIHYGKRSNLSHHPIDQYNGRISKPSMDSAALRVYHYSFHKKLSNMVISFCAVEQPVESLPVHQDDDSISSGSEATVKEGTKMAESTKFIVGEYMKLNESDSPNLSKLFSGASIVSKYHLNALLLELFKILGNKSSALVDFEYKNGNRGHAILSLRSNIRIVLKSRQRSYSGLRACLIM
jgi:hypothetical protein